MSTNIGNVAAGIGSSFRSKKRNASCVTAVSASQFVFTNANTNASTTHLDETHSYIDAASGGGGGGDSNYGTSKLSTSHVQGGFSKPSSLFAKLNSASTRPGAMKRRPSIVQ